MSLLQCPWCGWIYNPQHHGDNVFGVGPHEHVPDHPPRDHLGKLCPGAAQHPRNFDTDKRPLWQDDVQVHDEDGEQD